MAGPGTHLKQSLSWLEKLVAPGNKIGCGSCSDRANLMDQHGVAWCEKNQDIIVGWLMETATQKGISLGVPGVEGAARFAAKRFVRQAIRRAKNDEVRAGAKANQGKKKSCG